MRDFFTNNTPQVLIFFGSLAAIAGALWSSFEDAKKDKEIVVMAQENSRLSKQINDILIGEGSYPNVIMGFNRGDDFGVPALAMKGNYALQHVSGTFIDIRALREHQRQNGFDRQFQGDKFTFYVISPAFGNLLVEKKYNISNGGRFLVKFYTPYHKFYEYLAVEKMPGEDYYLNAYHIYKDDSLMITEYPDNFPIPLEDINFLESFSDAETEALKKMSDETLPF